LSAVYQITRAAELKALADFRDFIAAACQEQGLDDGEVTYDLKLAVDEACTNIVTHGYAGMDPGSIILALEFTPGRVVVHITDFGHSFEPAETPKPDLQSELQGEHGGGFGLFFIYQTMDQVDYAVTEDGNCLTFVKYLSVKHP
jgi:anti-sigma regulatory factor (Ser/Thr protein kinase)